MSNVTFQDFKKAVQSQVETMNQTGLWVVGVDKDTLWETYIESFPAGTNKIYREKREYECNCCKSFIRKVGGLVTIIDNKLVSVWDIEVGGYYQPVIEELRKLVHSSEVVDRFFHYEDRVGTDYNHETLADGSVKTWDHFYAPLVNGNVTPCIIPEEEIGTKMNLYRTQKETLYRSLSELSAASAEAVLDLVYDNNIYRGAEYKVALEMFLELKAEFESLPEEERHNYAWIKSEFHRGIRGTMMGSLLIDLTDGRDLESAVLSYESKAENYKRTTAVVTKGMVESAQKTVVALGLEDSLHRRYAVTEDLTVNNVLFANRPTRKAMNAFDELADEVGKKVFDIDLKKAEELSITDFLANVVPKANSLEVMVENCHINNLVNLVAPIYPDAPSLFKWDNGFSWNYNGEVADSIREKVKKAGGNVEGVLRCSLSWSNKDDLDIHVVQPSGRIINFRQDEDHTTGGKLDIDMNAYGELSENAVENIFWKSAPPKGRYKVVVKNFTKRCTDASKQGYEIEVDHNGSSTIFSSETNPRDGQEVKVVEFDFDPVKGIKFVGGQGKQRNVSQNIWGIDTGSFHTVNMAMLSPNFWDDNKSGNKHWFFMLEGCKNPEQARGFYNEFLPEELTKHRKVFEVLGSKLKTEKSDNQLSGIGFSSTQRSHAYFKADNRLFKVLF